MEEKELIKSTFIQYVLDREQALDEGNSKKANRIHNKIATVYKKAKKKGYIDIFHSLLNHENENVRLWAAGFSLKTEPELAEATLNKLLYSDKFIMRMSAKVTLELFHKKDWEHLLV